ncbi:GNAT family N-acetyltransferase [Methanosarcina mazei]|uniref:Acetyltransferase n=1 Tax=Methanosarcina mazei S-6 TaxID=213585 RepID=A0A0E3RJD3_METMZ|nr:GNAT family N-acetyltransferase [Methanosarcina mazei]AKB66258.1 Acetyltransferase [Methanosarcina mazei S-6]
MINVEYTDGAQESLYLIESLWQGSRTHHKNKSKYFADTYANKRFQDRVNELTDDSKAAMRVNLVKDKDTGQYIGYCISTIDKEMIGEIDSLYVEKEYRKHGIGSQLMEKALEWLDKNKVKSKIVAVGDGNEKVIDFYNHYGFYIRKIILEQVSN